MKNKVVKLNESQFIEVINKTAKKMVEEIIKKNYYPETKEMNYSNISDVQNVLKDINKLFAQISPIIKEADGKFGGVSYNDFAYKWRRLEFATKLLENQLLIKPDTN